MTDLLTFHLFPSLPSEIRLQIWRETLPKPRIVPIRFSRLLNQYTTDTTPYPLLHANRESRSLYLERYTRLILSPKYDSAIFVDFAEDTLFFDSLDCSPDGDLAYDLACSPHRDKILRVAIDAQLWEVLRVFRFESLSEVKMLGALKSVALVMKRDNCRGNDTGLGVGGYVQIEAGNTVEAEIMNVHWHAESLRWEIEHGGVKKWENGPPNVQLWLW